MEQVNYVQRQQELQKLSVVAHRLKTRAQSWKRSAMLKDNFAFGKPLLELKTFRTVSYTHLRAHETEADL
eukprot:6491397-Amphidinium_carterae.3